MRTFQDNAGRTWTVQVNLDAIKRVRGRCSFDLLEILRNGTYEQFLRDPVLTGDVLYAVCQAQAEAQGVSVADFDQALAGDALGQATRALLEALVDFYQDPRDRANLRRVLQLMYGAMDRVRDQAEQRLDSGAVEQAVERLLTSGGSSSTAAPGSSASTPDP